MTSLAQWGEKAKPAASKEALRTSSSNDRGSPANETTMLRDFQTEDTGRSVCHSPPALTPVLCCGGHRKSLCQAYPSATWTHSASYATDCGKGRTMESHSSSPVYLPSQPCSPFEELLAPLCQSYPGLDIVLTSSPHTVCT